MIRNSYFKKEDENILNIINILNVWEYLKLYFEKINLKLLKIF